MSIPPFVRGITGIALLVSGAIVANGAAPKGTAPRDMKLLVVAVDGNEPDYAAIKFFVETLGIPYQTAFTLDTSTVPPVQRPLPALTDGSKGFYQGILLTNGNTGYCYSAAEFTCTVGLTPEGWTALETYARDFGVRIASYYTYPEPRYGLTAASSVTTTDATPLTAAFTGPAAALFPYLNTANPLKIANSYVYLAKSAPASGETTTPFLISNGSVLGALHTKADGREYMALTIDNNPNLQHSLILNYGIINWVMKGVFIGGRKVYLTPQVDDHFLANDLFVNGNWACMPGGSTNDPTYDPAGACPTLRINGQSLKALADWQTNWNKKTQFQRFRVTHAFNGFGSVDDNGVTVKDDLVNQTVALRAKFFWINHTWDHEDLDCYHPAPNSGAGSCTGIGAAEAAAEISKNVAQAKALGLPLDSLSMVTPGITGLNNPVFLNAAAAAGIRYVVSDTSKPGYLPAIPNTGIYNPIRPSILMIPRRPTNIFYNTTTSASGAAGSLTDEYNYFFGPNGIFKINGTIPFFNTAQTYSDILNRESDALLTYMLRAEVYPQMYHQSNLHLYNGRNSLFSDVHDAAFNKFAKISKLPVISLTQSDLGRELEARMAVINARVSGVWTPGTGVTLKGAGAANVPVTGVCFGTSCESYGGQCVSKVPLTSGAAVNLAARTLTSACAANPGLPEIPVPPTPAVPTSAPNGQYQNAVAAQQTVAALVAQTNLPSADIKRLQEIEDLLTDALDPSLWINGDSLNPDEGKAMFDAQQKAAKQIMAALKDRSSQVNSAVWNALLYALCEIDQTIAQLSIREALLVAGSSKKTADALQEFAKGNEAYSSGKYDDAIDRYGKAWQSAEKAIDEVN